MSSYIEFIPRPSLTKEPEIERVTVAVESGNSPFDIIDFEDELTTLFSQAGYMLPVNDLLPADFWDDFPPEMKAYSDVWSARNGEVFRVIHNWEMPYWWYRKDWFDARGVAVPTTWAEVRTMGEIFTEANKGVWASEDTLQKGGFLNVTLAWLTLQAGGDPFEVGEAYQLALEYLYGLMHQDKVLNPASLQKLHYQQNDDYLNDKVAFMRQCPYFYEVVHRADNAFRFKEGKAVVALPPVGPGGKANSTYAAGWGFGLLKTAPNLDAAKEVFKFLVSPEAAAAMASASEWYVSARKSVLAAVGDQGGVVDMLKLYTGAGIIGVRPHHPQFVKALTVLEDTATAFLTDRIKLDESLQQAKDRLAQL